MRSNNETVQDIADHFKIRKIDVAIVFEKISKQTKTPEDVLEHHKILNEFPYTQTNAKQIRILDGISKDVLLEYIKKRWGVTRMEIQE